MHTVTPFVWKRVANITLLVIAAVLALSFVAPIQAHAMQTDRWTAKSTEKGSDEVMGATPARITWHGQSDAQESLKGIVLKLPDGTSVEEKNIKVTVLAGLDRLNLQSDISLQGSEVAVTFATDTPVGALIMIEFNQALLPVSGGNFGVEGSYTTSDGVSHDLPASDKTIQVIGTTPDQQIASWLDQQAWVKAWNSSKFLHLFLDPTIVVTSIPRVFVGWLLALGMVAISFPLAVPFGLIWSFLRMAKHRFPRALGATYINIVRGTPLFLQIYIAYFGLPLMGIKMENFVLGVIVLLMNSSAYLAEIFRAGIQSISRGQFEAARSLGMNGIQTMFFVIIPQTIRRVIPTMTSEFILMFKDTSLLAAVGVMEIMMYAKTITAATGNVTPYIVAAAFYLVVTIPMTKFINAMEVRLTRGRRRHKKIGAMAVPLPGGEAGSDAAVAHSIRLSETFAGPTSAVPDDLPGDAPKFGDRLGR